MEIHKKDEARLTRVLSYCAILIFVIWGGREFGRWLVGFKPLTKLLGPESLVLPYYGMPLRLGVLIGIVLTIGIGLWLWRYMNRPRTADMLIETETEMKKVSWPTWEDAKQSTSIVVVFVLATAAYLTVIEVVLKYVFDFILV